MVGVFSKVRAAIMNLDQMRRYTLYAIGEVLLIVVGILIAIQLDSAQQYRSERALEKRYIENLIEDVRFEVERSNSWFDRFEDKVRGLQTAKEFYFEGGEPEDPDAFLTTIGFGGAGSRGRVLAVTTTFEELISTGNLRYIMDDDIKSSVLDFYTTKNFINVYAANLRSEFATYTNSGRPFDRRGELVPDPRDVPIALERFRRPEFLELVNQEFTFAYSVNWVMEQHVEDARVLLTKLEAYLATF